MKFLKLTTDKGYTLIVNAEAVESFGKDGINIGTTIIFRTGSLVRVKDSIDDIYKELEDVKIIHQACPKLGQVELPMKYFVHHESCCVWRQEGDLREEQSDGLVEEVDENFYHRLISEGYSDGGLQD